MNVIEYLLDAIRKRKVYYNRRKLGPPKHNWSYIGSERHQWINGFEKFNMYRCANCGRTGTKMSGYNTSPVVINSWDGIPIGSEITVECNPEHYDEFRKEHNLPQHYEDCSEKYKVLYILTYGPIVP